jgi:hypothetical protein
MTTKRDKYVLEQNLHRISLVAGIVGHDLDYARDFIIQSSIRSPFQLSELSNGVYQLVHSGVAMDAIYRLEPTEIMYMSALASTGFFNKYGNDE